MNIIRGDRKPIHNASFIRAVKSVRRVDKRIDGCIYATTSDGRERIEMLGVRLRCGRLRGALRGNFGGFLLSALGWFTRNDETENRGERYENTSVQVGDGEAHFSPSSLVKSKPIRKQIKPNPQATAKKCPLSAFGGRSAISRVGNTASNALISKSHTEIALMRAGLNFTQAPLARFAQGVNA